MKIYRDRVVLLVIGIVLASVTTAVVGTVADAGFPDRPASFQHVAGNVYELTTERRGGHDGRHGDMACNVWGTIHKPLKMLLDANPGMKVKSIQGNLVSSPSSPGPLPLKAARQRNPARVSLAAVFLFCILTYGKVFAPYLRKFVKRVFDNF